jgi:hypothetical protein
VLMHIHTAPLYEVKHRDVSEYLFPFAHTIYQILVIECHMLWAVFVHLRSHNFSAFCQDDYGLCVIFCISVSLYTSKRICLTQLITKSLY